MTALPTPDTEPLRMRAEPLHAFVAALWARAGSSEREGKSPIT